MICPIPKLTVPLPYCLRRGLRLKDGPGSTRATAVIVWLMQGFIHLPSVRTGPSRLGPAGEGRSDGGVLHLHPQGQARYPEGGQRREDEPPGEGWRVRAKGEDAGHQGDEHLETHPRGGSAPVPRCVWPRRPRCFTPDVLRGRGRIFPAPAREIPQSRALPAVASPRRWAQAPTLEQ
jgi:hypothetical protein